MEEIGLFGVVPVLVIDDAESSIPVANALIDGRLPVAEATFRTEAAKELKKEMQIVFLKCC